MATIKAALTLKHQANLGEEAEDLEFAAGTEVTVLKEWSDHYLIKDAAGRLFNVPKDSVEG